MQEEQYWSNGVTKDRSNGGKSNRVTDQKSNCISCDNRRHPTSVSAGIEHEQLLYIFLYSYSLENLVEMVVKKDVIFFQNSVNVAIPLPG